MVKKKGKSKRMTLKQKYKIERKVKDHKRKVRKETKRRAKLGLPPVGIGKKKKDMGIPNSWPFKEELLQELEVAKERQEEEKRLKKEEAAQRRKQALLGMDVSQLVQEAQSRQRAFDSKMGKMQKGDGSGGMLEGKNLGQQSRRAYIRDLKKVVEQADVILQVLDARDPLGSRAEAMEELILRKPDKKLVLVLNKVDLVPKAVVADWLAYLRRTAPTVAFKATTQEQRSGLSQHGGDAEKADANVLSRSGSVGTDALLQLLKNYCRNLDIKTSITVGIIGYPNVGKSSIINSLKRAKSVGVSPTPGFTKSMQEIQLDRHIKLLDSPGIVFDDDDTEAVLLRNCINVESLPDPVPAVEALLRRCAAEDLMMIYALPKFDEKDAQGFLALLAKKKGKLLKGGTPDRNAAARIVLRDWNTGKVPFYTRPPQMEGAGADKSLMASESKILTSLGPEFDVLKDGDAKVMEWLEQGESEVEFLAMDSGGQSQARSVAMALEKPEDEAEDDLEDEEEEDEMALTGARRSNRRQEVDSDEEEEEDEEGEEEEEDDSPPQPKSSKKRKVLDAEEATINPQVNQDAKRSLKAEKKRQRKASNRQKKKDDEDYEWTEHFSRVSTSG